MIERENMMMLSFSGQLFLSWLLISMAKLDTLIPCPTWKAEAVKSGTTAVLHVGCGHAPALPAVVLLSCWHSISGIVCNSVPQHVPDLTTTRVHIGYNLLLSPILLLLYLP